MEVALIWAFVAAAGIYLIFRLNNQSGPSTSHTWRSKAGRYFGNASKHHGAYQAVSLVPGEGACSAITELGEKRFLTDEAPSIPVPGCHCIECDCKYMHHEDRRKGGPDRRQLKDRRALFRKDEAGRRRNRGRRRSDWSPLAA